MIAPSRPDPDDLDAQLMVRIKEGDLEVFETLVRRNRTTVMRFIQHFRAPHSVDREDLVQQVFFRVYKSRHTYFPTAKFSSWLYTITRNVVSNANRQLARRREVSLTRSSAPDFSSQSHLEVVINADPAGDMILTESRQAVQRAMMRLGKRQQMALQLVDFLGYSYQAAADELTLTEMALKSLVQRARMALKKSLEKEHGENILDLLKSGLSSHQMTLPIRRS